jgi:hypothetical protein
MEDPVCHQDVIEENKKVVRPRVAHVDLIVGHL